MALINWSPSLSIGIEEIDSQHKVLIKYINDLNEAMVAGKSKEAMLPILQGLLDYTVTHFGYEERLFAKYNYPDTASHKKKHMHFIDKIKEFKVECESGKFGLTIKVMNFLSDWLKTHIQGTDTQYVPFFREKGVSFEALKV